MGRTPGNQPLASGSSLSAKGLLGALLLCSQHCGGEASVQVMLFPLPKMKEADVKLHLNWYTDSREQRAYPQVV